MKLKKLYEQWKMCRGKMSRCNINWRPFIFFDNENFETFIIPTIGFTPWFNLQPYKQWDCMFKFIWLNFMIGIGYIESYKEDGESNNV